MIKLVAIALVCGILIIYLRTINSELTSLAIIGAGILIISQGFNYLYQTYSFLTDLVKITGIGSQFYSIIFKITAIGYLVEFGAGTVEDMGLKSLADKLVFAGKALIILVSMPILYGVFNLLKGIVQ